MTGATRCDQGEAFGVDGRLVLVFVVLTRRASRGRVGGLRRDVSDRTEVSCEEITTLAANIYEGLPDNFIMSGIAGVRDKSKELVGKWVFVEGVEMVVAEEDGYCAGI
jgi:hypothetical protein